LFAVRSGEYGILLTDLHMPEMDGYGVVAAIRADDEKTGKHFPVIALTADVQMAQRQVYMGHGFDECLLKPVSLGQLRRLLIRWGLVGESAEPAPASSAAAASPSTTGSAIDREAMIAQMGAFDENAIEMLKLFIDMTQPLVERIAKAGEQNDVNGLKEAAHSLKGAARSACLNDLGEAAALLQHAAESNAGGYLDLTRKVDAEFIRAKAEIETL
jgi:CheY-like chemotaxis protein